MTFWLVCTQNWIIAKSSWNEFFFVIVNNFPGIEFWKQNTKYLFRRTRKIKTLWNRFVDFNYEKKILESKASSFRCIYSRINTRIPMLRVLYYRFIINLERQIRYWSMIFLGDYRVNKQSIFRKVITINKILEFMEMIIEWIWKSKHNLFHIELNIKNHLIATIKKPHHK